MMIAQGMFGWPRLILEKIPVEKCEELIERFLQELEEGRHSRGLVGAGSDNQPQKSALLKEVCQRRKYLCSSSPNFIVEGAWRVTKNELFP